MPDKAPVKTPKRNITLRLLLPPALILLLLAGGLVWYSFATAPARYPAVLRVQETVSRPPLNPYPELEGVLIPLYTADAKMLEQLPGIGPTRAADIVAYVRKHAPLESIDQLADVRGVGPATLEKIRPYITLDPIANTS